MNPDIQRMLDNIEDWLDLLTQHRLGAVSDGQLHDLQNIVTDLKEVCTSIALAQHNMQAQLEQLTANFASRQEFNSLRDLVNDLKDYVSQT